MNKQHERVARIAAALNDRTRSTIADPRRGQYTVTFATDDIKYATSIEHALTGVGVASQTNYRRDNGGRPIYAYVVLYDYLGQQKLLELVRTHLETGRLQELDRLVLARGPIPSEYKTRIRELLRTGSSATRIAKQMNERGIIAGMGGKHWTPKKVNAAVADA